jgi:DNA-binding response OmpR family regulator
MRRPQALKAVVLEHCGVALNTSTHEVHREGKSLELSTKEFALLEFLMRHPGRVVSRIEIMESLWESDFDPRSNIVDAMIRLLRRKIDKGFAAPLIQTLRGLGYRFSASQ